MTRTRVGPPHSPAWYAARKRVVTASAGYHLVMKPGELRWHKDEHELAESILVGGGIEPNERMDAGTHFEVPNMAWLGSRVGRIVEPDGWLTLNSGLPSMGASLDGRLGDLDGDPPGYEPFLTLTDGWGRVLTGHRAVAELRGLPAGALLEMKQSPSRNRSQWKGEPPAYYVWQVRHQMAVADDTDVGLLVAKVDGHELYAHLIERDTELEKQLVDACGAFHAEHIAPSHF